MRRLDQLRWHVMAWLDGQNDTVPHYEGSEHVAAHHSPPRYVWVPDKDFPASKKDECDAELAPSLYTFRERFQVRIWGEDFNDAYRLRNNLLNAIYAAPVQTELDGDSGWIDPDKRGVNEKGNVYVLQMAMIVPVLEGYNGVSLHTTAVATTLDVVTTALLPSGEEVVGAGTDWSPFDDSFDSSFA